jgi:hypothetical protein
MAITPGTPLDDFPIPTAPASANAAAIRTALGAGSAAQQTTNTANIANLQTELDGKLAATPAAVQAQLAAEPAEARDAQQIGFIPTAYSTSFSGLTYTAVETGPPDGDITVAHVVSGNNTALSVSVTARAITVNLATDSDGVATSTAAAVAAAVNNTSPAAALVTASAHGAGSFVATAQSATTLTHPLSGNGGASKIPQFDESGRLQTGPASGTGTSNLGAGTVFIPDLQAVRWLKKDGTPSGALMYMWQDHDQFGGELIIDSPWRIALTPPGHLQLGSNSSGNRIFYIHTVSGASTATVQSRHSPAYSYGTTTWNGSASVGNRVVSQAVPKTGGHYLRWYDNGTIAQEAQSIGSMNGNAGLAGGDLMAEMTTDGLWTPGLNPASAELADAATVTQTCSKYKSRQVGHVTLTDNRNLEITGADDGMIGTLLVSQDTTGNRTITLPQNIVTPSGFALSTAGRTTDRLDWIYHAGKFHLHRAAAFPFSLDPDAETFLTGASITDETIELAINQLVLDLKAAEAWALFDAFWPFVGASAAAHARDLKNTYHITNDSAWQAATHNASGVTGNGTSAFGKTGINYHTIGGRLDDFCAYFYSKSETPTANGWWFGGDDGTGRNALYPTGSTNISCRGPHSGSSGTLTASAGGDFRKSFFLGRSSSTQIYIDINGTTSPGTNTSTAVPNRELYLLAGNGSGAAAFSNVNLGACGIGRHMTADQRNAVRAAVNAFQTALGRANP